MADQEIPANSQAETKSPVSVQEFSKKIKEKYPSYKDVDDMELATKIVEKYPEYKNKVHFDAAPSPSTTGTPPIDYGPFNPEDIDKHPQTKQNYERWKTDQSQEPPKEGESKNQPYIKKLGNVLGNGLATGAAMLNRGIADTPEYLDRFGDALIVNPIRNLLGMEPVHVGGAGKFLGTDKISEYYAKQQDAYNKNIEKTIDDTGKGIWADVGNKDYANASLRLAAGLAESASASIAMMAMPAAGIGALGSIGAGTVIFGSSKMRELDESSPNMSEEAKMINATVNGALEGIFETFFGSGAVGGSLSKMVKSVGRKEGEVIVEKGIRGAVSDLILKYPALAPLGEAYEEAATQMAQNATDILTGNTNVKSVFEGVADAATIGAVSGGVHGGTIRAVSSITKKINDKIDTSVLNSANTEGIDAFGNVVSRTKVKKFHEQATSDLGDIPNANYTEAVNNLIENYTDPTEIITQLNKLSDDMVVSQSEYQKAFNFIKSSFTVNSMNKAKMANIQEGIDKFQDNEGNMVSATINGEQFFIRNSEDLGQEGRTIFAKNSKGEVKPFRADQVTEWEVQSPDDIINLTNTNEQSEDDQYNAIEELNNKAAKKGIVPEKSVHTPNGIAKVSAINEDSTITVINQKGEPSIYSIDEIAPYKTDEQKQQEKDQLKKEEEGIAMIPEMFKLDGNVYQWTNDINSVVRDEEGEITGFNVTNQDTGETEQLNADQMNDVLSRYAQDAKPDNKQEATRTETKEEVPQEEAQPEIPMDKEGNPDYDQMEPEMFFTQYSEEFGEEDARNEVKGMQKAITDKIKKLTAKKEKATTPNQRASIAREIKAMGSQLEGINKIIESDRPTEDTGNDTQWIAENSNDPIEIALAFEQENQNTPSNQLTEWQQATLGVKFNPESFNRFSDKNNTTQTLAKTWLSKDGVSIDQFIKDNFEDTPGFENVTEQDVIDFILANPSGNIRSTTDTQNELRRKYREQTGTSIDNHQFDQETLPTQAKLESFLADNNITDWFTTEDLIELVEQNKSKLNENDYNDFTEYLNTELANQQSSTNEWLDEETDSGVQEQVDSSKENGNESIVSTTEEPAVKDNNPAVDNANVDQKASETPVNTEVPIESGETILEQSEKLDPESSPKNLNISEAAQADLKDRRNALNALDKISTELGQSAEVVNSSEIPENVKKEKRQRIAEGKETVGFYNPEDGKIYIISDRITKVSEAKKTFIHELVVHKGLKGLFETENPQSILGKQYGKFNDLMLDVFGSMTEEEIERTRKSYFSNIDIEFFTNSKYNKRNEVLNKLQEDISQKTAINIANELNIDISKELTEEEANKITDAYVKSYMAEEFMAQLSESETIPTQWQSFIDRLVHLVRKTVGLTSSQFTQSDLLNIIKEQRERMTQGQETVRSSEDGVRFRTEEQSDIIQNAKKYTNANDFIDAYKDADFRDMHSSPGNSMSDLTIEERMDEGDDFNLTEVVQGFSIQPTDYFDPMNGPRWYGYNNAEGMQSYRAIRSVMNNIQNQIEEKGEITKIPNIKAYRAVPNSVEQTKLVDRDWVTFSKGYAVSHGEHRFGENKYKIITETVPADKVWWDGNNINEWGYDSGTEEVLGRSDLRQIWDEANAPEGSNNIRFRVASSKEELDDFVKDSEIKKYVYHGTNINTKELDISMNSVSGFPDAIYFSSNNRVSKTYGQNIIKAKIKMVNPYYYNAEGSTFNNVYDRLRSVFDTAINSDRDGVVITNIYDDWAQNGKKGKGTTYAVFSNNQILIEPKGDVKFRIAEESKSVNTDPSEAQKEAGNYQMGHIKLDGFDISIENPKGSIRKGTDPDGNEWEREMPATYGYFKGTVGKDKDHIDVFLGDNPESDKVYVVDQIDPKTGVLDEHKVMMGFDNISKARRTYQAAYDEEWKGLKNITRTTKDQLKDWFENGDQKRSFKSSGVKFRQTEKTDESPEFKGDELDYKFDNDNAEYFVRFSDFIDEDLKRGWSSWNFGEDGVKGDRDKLDRILKTTTDENPVTISGFDIYPDDVKDFEFGELYPNYWVAKDNINAEGGLSSHALPSNLIDIRSALSEINSRKGTYDGTGEGQSFNTSFSKVIFSKGDMHIIEVGENKINRLPEHPQNDNSDIRFRQSDKEDIDPIEAFDKIKQMGEIAAALQKRKNELKRTQTENEKQAILGKIEGIKEGAKAGKKDTRAEIKLIQSTIVDYAHKHMPLGDSNVRQTLGLITVIKNAHTPGAIERAFIKIDELASTITEKSERNRDMKAIKRVMKWMTTYKTQGASKAGEFQVEDVRQFSEMKDFDKQAKVLAQKVNSRNATDEEKLKASKELDALWDTVDSKENKNLLDETLLKLIELRKNGAKASASLVKAIAEDLQTIYNQAKDAKTDEDIERAIERRDEKEFVKSFVRGIPMKDKSKVSQQRMKADNVAANSMGNWETVLTMIGGNKMRDKFSFILNQVNQEVETQNTFNSVMEEAAFGYGFDTGKKGKKQMEKHLNEMKEKKFSIVQAIRERARGEGVDQELSILDIIDIYNTIKNEMMENDMYLAYGDPVRMDDPKEAKAAQMKIGKERIDKLLSNLSDGDKAFGDAMQASADSYWDKVNDVFVRTFNRDLPKRDNYWPSTAEFADENDAFSQFKQDAMNPSFTKQTAAHRIPVITDAFDKYSKHIKAGEWYANMALPVARVNKIMKNHNVKKLIEAKRGKKFYETITYHLAEQGLFPPSQTKKSTDVEKGADWLLNNWVAAAIGLTPSVPIKQLLSTINYAENMPILNWMGGFVKNLATFRSTWKEMMEIPYLRIRFGEGYSEAVQRAISSDDKTSILARGHQELKKTLTAGTRYGDIAAIVFGGKPYIDYLMKTKKMSKADAIDQFILDTLRSQQAPFSSTLSQFQHSKNFANRALFAFSNTPSQYNRKMIEANHALKNGDINKKQAAKIYSIYLGLASANYVIVGALIRAAMSGSDWDDDLKKSIISQTIVSLVGGVPFVKDVAEVGARLVTGQKVYDDVNPVLDLTGSVLKNGYKALEEEDGLAKYGGEFAKDLSQLFGISGNNVVKLFNATPGLGREKTFREAKAKTADKHLKELSSKYETAHDLKYSYSSTKSKATKLEGEGKKKEAEKLRELVDDSKVRLSKTNYTLSQLKRELKRFDSELKEID